MATPSPMIASLFGRVIPPTLLAFSLFVPNLCADTVDVSALDLSKVRQDWGQPGINRSVDGHPLTIAGRTFATGVGSHASSRISIDLKKSAQRFTALVGVDDEPKVGPCTVEFRVVGDGRMLWESGVMKVGDAAKSVDVDLTGVSQFALLSSGANDGTNGDHADWAEAKITYQGARPEVVSPPVPKAVILTPKPGPEPRINGPSLFGVRPGSPFLYRIPATGKRPMTFSAEGLPKGLSIDQKTGIITGAVAGKGNYAVTLGAKNSLGTATRKFRVVIGDKIALTPPMGWNSWNCWGPAVTQEKVLASAKALVESGLVDHGWSYVNTDDFWTVNPGSNDPTLHGPERAADGTILTNPRFPDIKAMVDKIHALGLKAGIYSSPGPLTCGGCISSYQHEAQDARQMAEWGFDYLKYDWCSYGQIAPKDPSLAEMKKPYVLMGEELAKQKRDILYSLCQYGMGDVWEWGASVGGNCWRTTGDIIDTWASLTDIGFNQERAAPYAGPGHWNDPDMLIVGKVGWGPNLHPTRLDPNEQYTHISLWCLLASPLLIGCDLTDLDDFTLSLLTNDEVLAVNQDSLGQQATQIAGTRELPVYAKWLEDGSVAVGLFNLSDVESPVSIDWKSLGVKGSQTVRDLWRQKDVATAADKFEATVAPHGVVLVRVFPAKR